MALLVDQVFGSNDAEPGRMRREVRRRLPGLSEDVAAPLALCVSELVTNALMHGLAPYRLVVEALPGCLRVTVMDRSQAAPRQIDEPGEDGGFGMVVVDGVARAWGCDPLPGGKAVWAEMPIPIATQVA